MFTVTASNVKIVVPAKAAAKKAESKAYVRDDRERSIDLGRISRIRIARRARDGADGTDATRLATRRSGSVLE